MRTLIKIMLGLVGVAIVAIIALLFIDFDSPRLTAAVVRIAEEKGGVELEIGRLAFNVRKGVLLEAVVARAEAEGEILEVSLDRLILEHRLWPLLRGQVVVKRLILQRPVVEMISSVPGSEPEEIEAGDAATPPEPLLEGTTESGDSDFLHLEIGEIVIEDARFISSSSHGAGVTELTGLNLQLRDIATHPDAASLLLGLSAQGWLEAASLSLGKRQLTDIASAFSVDRGHYRIDSFETDTAAGLLRVEEIDVDLTQNPYRYRLSIAAESIDLNRILGFSGGLGLARLDLQGTGEGPGLEGAVAEISLHLEPGTLPSIEILKRIDQIVGTSLDGATHESLEILVSLAGGTLEVEPFTIVTEIARLGAAGSVAIGGEINLKVRVGIPRDLFARDDISDDVLDSLTDREQWLTIPLQITGTTEKPRFGPDMDAVRDATRRLAQQARESLQKKIRTELTGAIGRRLGGES